MYAMKTGGLEGPERRVFRSLEIAYEQRTGYIIHEFTSTSIMAQALEYGSNSTPFICFRGFLCGHFQHCFGEGCDLEAS